MTEVRNGQKSLAGKHEGRYRCRCWRVLRWMSMWTGSFWIMIMWQTFVNMVINVWLPC